MDAFIKLQRKLLDWEWYSDINTKVVFLHCLLKANWKDGRYKGVAVPRGSFVTGRKVLAEELGLSEQQVRTALDHLKSTNEITIKSTSRFSVITVVNYVKYQTNDQQINQQSTNEQPTSNQQLTTIEEYKNKNNEKNNKSIRFTPPTLKEVEQYCRERNNNVNAQRFIDYYISNGWKVGKNPMKDWKAAVRSWESRDKPPARETNPVTWGSMIYDPAEEQHPPRFGFPSEWFKGNTLITENVRNVIHPKDTSKGIYEAFEVKVPELINLFELRRSYYEQHNSE